MTSIISSQITQSNLQVDGRFVVEETHIDSNNVQYILNYMAEANTDQNAHLAADAAVLNANFAYLKANAVPIAEAEVTAAQANVVSAQAAVTAAQANLANVQASAVL